MTVLRRAFLITAILFATACTIQSAATELPANLCSLLPAAELSKTFGQAYDDPQKSVAPRFSAGTATGTDCNYQSKDAAAGKLLFRAYVDPSSDETKWLFLRLTKFYKTTTPVSGLGDEAYFDDAHGLHVRKGNVRLFFNLIPTGDFGPEKENQMKIVASGVVAQL